MRRVSPRRRAASTRTSILEYLVWAWHWATPESTDVPWHRCVRLELGRRQAARKRWATHAFATQIRPFGPDHGGRPLLPDSVLRRFWRPFEVFIERSDDVDAPHLLRRDLSRGGDPWDFESSPYEQRKYDVTIASLPRFRYRSAYEPGCSIGVLTELLAPRCDRLLSTDIVPCAVQRAQRRLRGAPHVRIQERSIPDQWPAGLFDLVVLSEIAYYFDVTDLGSVIARSWSPRSLAPTSSAFTGAVRPTTP